MEKEKIESAGADTHAGTGAQDVVLGVIDVYGSEETKAKAKHMAEQLNDAKYNIGDRVCFSSNVTATGVINARERFFGSWLYDIESDTGYIHHRVLEKAIEPYEEEQQRWRVTEGESFYFVNAFLQVCSERHAPVWMETKAYDSGNYFRTRAEAERLRDAMKLTINAIHGTAN